MVKAAVSTRSSSLMSGREGTPSMMMSVSEDECESDERCLRCSVKVLKDSTLLDVGESERGALPFRVADLLVLRQGMAGTSAAVLAGASVSEESTRR